MNGHSDDAVNQPDEDPILAEHRERIRRMERVRKEKRDEAMASLLFYAIVLASVWMAVILAGCVLAKH